MIFDSSFIMYIGIVCIVLLALWIIRLEIKIKGLLIGKDAKSLEDSIVNAHTMLDNLFAFKNESIGYYKDVEERLTRSIQAVETVRFNPFKGTGEGGNQSFSTAFVSEKGDGVVISSLYSRDRVSIFSKPLKTFGSEFELTEEEVGVVDGAKKHLS